MSLLVEQFWKYFNRKKIANAKKQFEQLEDSEKEEILAELFQKSQYSRTPTIVSILYRKLHKKKTLNDFHQAWFPAKPSCHRLQQSGQTFQQFFPAPTRVINAVNIKNPEEVLSIGFTWVDNESQGQDMWRLSTTNTQSNQERHDSIAKVADKISSKLYEPKFDDNLGIPF